MTISHEMHCRRLPITAHAVVEATLSQVSDLRTAADPAGSPTLPSRFLRHADDQTVAAVRAVQTAMASLDHADFVGHGVIAAPCQLGRPASSRTLSQFAGRGGPSVSTQIVPQCSLHSMASAISVGLLLQGANIGVGGGVGAIEEGLLTAFGLAEAPGATGWWLVFSEMDEEPLLDAEGMVSCEGGTADPLVRAVAMLATPSAVRADQRVNWTIELLPHVPAMAHDRGTTSLAALAAVLDGRSSWESFLLPTRTAGCLRLSPSDETRTLQAPQAA